MESLPQLHRVQVANGSGSLSFQGGGKCVRVGTRAPSASAVYNITIADMDGFEIVSRTQQTGHWQQAIETQLHGQHTINISVATEAGEYKVKIWHE